MKMLQLIVITVLEFSASRLVVADDQCNQYQFTTTYYPSNSCENIYNMNPESRDNPGYYWLLGHNGPSDVYCGMNYTGLSCEDIYNNNPELGDKNGYYPINNTDWTFCSMTTIAESYTTFSCAGVERQWKKIVGINSTAGNDCPIGWVKGTYSGVTFCRAPNDTAGCYSAFFSTNGVGYQHVCGRARGYQKGGTSAFELVSRSIDTFYVDGLSITYGDPRQHIWTYAAGLTDFGTSPCCNCPCASRAGTRPPTNSFVGNNYYCESGTSNTYSSSTYYFSDPLWDGAGCSSSNTCCRTNTNQPWFYRQLPTITQNAIEVRICISDYFTVKGILVDVLELYID